MPRGRGYHMDSRNRLWWVMAGVGLLLVVVLTGGLYWLSPVDTAVRSDLTLPRPRDGAAPFEYVAGQSASAEGVHGAAGAATGNAGTQGAVTDGGTHHVGVEVAARGTDAGAAASGGRMIAGTGAGAPAAPARPIPRVTVDMQASSSPATKPAVRAIPTSGVRATAAPAATRITPAAVTSGAGFGGARTAPVAKLAPPARLREFWVQVGSFASRSRADALGQRLSDQGIVSRVTTRTSGAELFFRVRVGPYASRLEAEKFLAWVQRVDGLDGSYISEVRNAGR